MSALTLRMIACCAMLLDHIGYSFSILPLRAIGRIAFPIFVYLIYNGYRHTSGKPKYALRLAVFAVISQIPFSLFCKNVPFDSNGNVFVSLLLALLCVWGTDVLLKNKIGRWFFLLPGLVICAAYYLGYLKSDYGARTIILALTFLLFDGKAWWNRLLMCLGCLISVFYSKLAACAVGLLLGRGLVLQQMSQWEWMQLMGLCALPLIFAYNGQKGHVPQGKWSGKLTQYGFYLFYPLHMLALWLIR